MFRFKIDDELELRLWEERYADQLFDLTDRNRAHLREWLPWVDATKTVADTKAYMKDSLEKFAANDGFNAGIWYKGQLVGGVGFHFFDWPDRKTEIGYWLGQDFNGKGIMTRTCRTLVNYAFKELNLNRVIILCATDNWKSRAIPERLGFTQEGTARQAEWLYDHFVDLVTYSMLASEWQKIKE